ncbi:hypothetical protein EVAR_67612_1 [Eumeta japonica]|uniref:Uncharacterized protein n=1 Tax=Eumeta variegata TaxID=151549 RepID=A0A4C2A858_EUMVA|nr:hypothetical protein EVAR_67612_1 [Eumeta japonica]
MQTIGAAILASAALTSAFYCIPTPQSTVTRHATHRRNSLRRCNKSFTLKTGQNLRVRIRVGLAHEDYMPHCTVPIPDSLLIKDITTEHGACPPSLPPWWYLASSDLNYQHGLPRGLLVTPSQHWQYSSTFALEYDSNLALDSVYSASRPGHCLDFDPSPRSITTLIPSSISVPALPRSSDSHKGPNFTLYFAFNYDWTTGH